jgi:hypothetical protein
LIRALSFNEAPFQINVHLYLNEPLSEVDEGLFSSELLFFALIETCI